MQSSTPNLAPAWYASPGQSASLAPTVVGSGPVASSSRSRKRPRTDINEIDVIPKLSARGLACPFYKNDPYKHVDCLGYASFDTVTVMKQHIERSHMCPPYYCPICGKTFKEQNSRDTHLVARTCKKRDISFSGMMSSDQHAEIKKITNGRKKVKNETQKWYEIWGVLFNGKAPPESPFRGPVEHESTANVQTYMDLPRFQNIWNLHYSELRNDTHAQEKQKKFITAIMDDHAIYADESRANATADVPPADFQEPYCKPDQVMGQDPGNFEVDRKFLEGFEDMSTYFSFEGEQ
ncbi:hypothetical protein PG995_004904 [Apiospora arundinis]